MPQVRPRYPTTDERALIGESLAGLFLHRARPQPVVEPGNDAGGCSQAAAGSDACAAARVPGQQRAAGAGSLCRAAGNAAGAALAVAAGEVPATAGGNPRHDLSSGRIAGAAHAVPGTAAGLALTALAPRCAPCKDAAAAPSGAPTATGACGCSVCVDGVWRPAWP
ncbi:hypothetical protein G6F63_014147 [Rhizopus arrhizus]|nr:hypothetical protein G6F63_014147 [Rhizopus arrhizus]